MVDASTSLLHDHLQGDKLFIHLHADAAKFGTQALQLLMAALDLGNLLPRERIRRMTCFPASVCRLRIGIPRSRSVRIDTT